MNKIVERIKIINSQRQPPNLKRILTRARFLLDEHIQTNKVTKCNQSLCGTCKDIKEGNSIILKTSGFTFNIKQPMSCTVGNVIYCITCQGCREQYIGETSNLKACVRLHKNHISSPIYRTMGVSEHIASCARNKDPMFTIMPFYKVKTEDIIFREKKQDYFIGKYKPKLNALQLGHLGNIRLTESDHHAPNYRKHHSNYYYVK